MELHFLGGAGEVGRSCVALTTRSKTIYLDCGLRMEGEMWLPLLNRGKRPDAVLLSHSHLDHCGAIPLLFKHSAPKVYCTTPTLAVCDVLYDDTMKIAKQQKQPAPFSQADLKKARQNFSALGYRNEFTLLPDLKFSFIDAGHIIGSSQIAIRTEGKKIVYTGDFKLGETRMHGGAEIEKNPDALIIESTYSGKTQLKRETVEQDFVNDVQEVIDEGGTALVPCFAVGRTQEILTLLNASNFRGDIYIDGMGIKVNEVYYQYGGYLKNAKAFKAALERVKVVSTPEEKREALSGGKVIICTAGMLEGGPVLGYLHALEKSGKNGKIFITGFQVPGTNGQKLLNGEPITLFNNGASHKLRVLTPFKKYEFSAHADETELLKFVEKTNVEKIICVHGDNTSGFAETLKEKGFDAIAPKNGDRINL